MTTEILEIVEIGAQGDGIARRDGGPVFVPYAAPGDRVLAEIGGAKGEGRAARLLDLVAAGPHRIPAVCRHFTRCGGCATQHVAGDAYRA